MNIFRLFYIFFKIRASGIFSTFGIKYNFLLVPFINKKNPEENFKEKLEDFGPVYIKLGQLLSTRTDLVSKKLSKELNKLTDDCEAVSFDYIKNTIETELGKKSKNILSVIETLSRHGIRNIELSGGTNPISNLEENLLKCLKEKKRS